MSGGKGGQTTSTASIPQWVQDESKANVARANEIAQLGPIRNYGPSVAAFNDNQISSFQNNADLASAFGMNAPADVMANMPTAQDYGGGVMAYGAAPLVDQQLATLQLNDPNQASAISRQFMDPGGGLFPAIASQQKKDWVMANGGYQQPMAMPTQPMAGGNVGQTSANAYNNAVNATGMGMGFTPQTVTPNTVAGTNMQPYQNPFQQQVIDASMADMNRANQMALNNVGAQAQGAGAYGGSRQGVAEAETNNNFARQAAAMTAGLNQAGYQNAQNMAQFDIGNNFAAQNQNNANNFAANQSMMGGANQLANLSQQGFDYSNRINENMLNTGNAQQNLVQQIINAANGQFGDIAQYPQNMLNLPVAALGGAQFPTTTTNGRNPGLFDYLTLGATSMGGGKIVTSAIRPDFDFIKEDIFRGESRGDYDALFNYQNRPGGLFDDIKVSKMTVDEALDFASPRSGYGNYVKMVNPESVYSTPMGAFQVVGNTLKMAKRGLGLRGDEIMTRQLQDRIGRYIYDVQGTDAWAGYTGPRYGPKPKGQEGAFMMDPDPQNEQKAQPGIMELLGNGLRKGLQNGDLMDRLALGFNTMRLEPDANLAAGIRESMADRRERTATSGAANRSVDVLRNMKGPDGQPIPEALEAANAIEANPSMATPILNSFYQMRASGRLTQQTQRYEFEGNVVTISTLKNNETVVKLNGEEVTDPAKISELVGLAQAFEIEQEARIAGGKSFATKEAERSAEVKIRYRNAVQLEDRSINIISRMLDDPQGLIDGLGPLVSMITSTSEGFGALSDGAKNFITNHEQLMGTVFTDVFEALKGGGSITENETRQAKQAAARMNRALNPSDYVDALREYRYRLGRAIEAYKGEMLDQEPTRTNTELNFEIFPEEL